MNTATFTASNKAPRGQINNGGIVYYKGKLFQVMSRAADGRYLIGLDGRAAHFVPEEMNGERLLTPAVLKSSSTPLFSKLSLKIY
jgi:hypothetical protein